MGSSFYTHTVNVDRKREWSVIDVAYFMSLLDHIIELLYKKFDLYYEDRIETYLHEYDDKFNLMTWFDIIVDSYKGCSI